jgi:outer membrane protein OmpA-like peptidoglycan-associated protein
MIQPPARLSVVSAPLGALALLMIASSAQAHDGVQDGPHRLPAATGSFALRIEPGAAIPLSSPQARLFDVGGGQTVKAHWALSPYWDIGPSVAFLALPAADGVSEAGTAWTFGGGVRLKRPHHARDDSFLAISPWVDVDALYVRTARLNRPGFAGAVGVAVPLGSDRTFWLGPFVRYLQILQGTPSGFDNRDARVLSIGLSLEVGARVERETRHVATTATPVEAGVREVPACPDRDRDGVPDQVDRCPDVAGTTGAYGCKDYQKLVVKPDKLELKEKLYFAWDQATIQEESFPALDEVVQALKDNQQFRVQVEGHSSSDGSDDHNQSLSSRRADAVVDYLVARGIAKERLGSKGFASSAPRDTNATAAGRENNRRVEFVVYFTILGDGAKTQ